jgi:Ca-activated chloride channel family protein
MRLMRVEAAYNAANGYYKMGRYKMAAGLYASIYFVDAEQNHQLFHNLGNALAKMGSYEELKKAVSAYEKALKFKEDRESRENLEAVKKELEKREDEIKRGYQEQVALGLSKLQAPSKKRRDEGGKSLSQKSEDLPYRSSEMSDREANKWLKTVQKYQHGQVYKIEVANTDEGVDSEKPW